MKTELEAKLFYSIGEIANLFDVNPSLIRFWEKEFDIIKPHKNSKGNRLFTQKDIENFKKIYDLVRVKGFTLEGAKRELKDVKRKQNEEKNLVVIKKLQEMRLFLEELKQEIQNADD